MRRLLAFGLSFALGGSLIFFSYNGLSLALDPYNVVRHGARRALGGLTLDQFRYEKTELLLRHPDRYDTVILGNSRGFSNETGRISAATGRSIFNYSVSSDYPLGYAMKLRFLLRTQKRLDTVVMLFWIDQFWMAGTNDGPLLAREHPDVSGESWWRYYWAFSELPLETFANAASFHLRRLFGLETNDRVVSDSGVDPETGDNALWALKTESLSAYRATAAHDPPGTLRFRDMVLSRDEAETKGKALAALPIQPLQTESFKATMALLKSSGLHYACVIPAMNANTVAWIPREVYLAWMKSVLDGCGELFDFSKPSPKTRDNYNYLDWSHYLPDVSYTMLTKVLRGEIKGIAGPEDFGSRVSPESWADFAAAFRAE